MAGKRLSDVGALVATPFGGDENKREHHTKEIRKIDNGYVTRESHDDGLGYTSMETYSAEHPDKAPGMIGAGTDSMKRAVSFMKKDC